MRCSVNVHRLPDQVDRNKTVIQHSSAIFALLDVGGFMAAQRSGPDPQGFIGFLIGRKRYDDFPLMNNGRQFSGCISRPVWFRAAGRCSIIDEAWGIDTAGIPRPKASFVTPNAARRP